MPSRDHARALSGVVSALRQNASVVAIGAYGSTAQRRWTFASDVDLLVVVDTEPPVESIRLRVGGVPVDVNLRAASDSTRGIGGATFVPETEPIWDPGDVLRGARTTALPPDPSSIRISRFALAHSVDKTRQLEGSPRLARLFAGGEAPFVVRGFYHARALWFPGPVIGLRYLEERAPELVNALLAIASGPDQPSTYLSRAAEIALAPVGGLWRDDEVFIVGWRPDQRDPDGERWVRENFGAVLDVAGERRTLV